ncbi:hypothetical protein B6U67_04655 [Methanosarcinales archaeon ex4484_138]|nr:MAG: hypothetical protein B6U67_04655 [Methanosarcinales archaeon ex4484_138]
MATTLGTQVTMTHNIANTMGEDEIIRKLSELLLQSVRRLARKRTAIAFSGGLDSSLITHLHKGVCKVELFTVYTKGSHDERASVNAASILGMEDRLHLYLLSEHELEAVLPNAIAALGSTSFFDLGIALPLYIASREAHRTGFEAITTGQGADELFGGYKRYETMKPKKLDEELRRDLLKLTKQDLKRDYNAARDHSIELQLPFLEPELVEFAKQIPAELKVRNNVRKYILQRTAQTIGLPPELSFRDKKAAQYSSGIQKTLKKIARRNGYGKNQTEQYLTDTASLAPH